MKQCKQLKRTKLRTARTKQDEAGRSRTKQEEEDVEREVIRKISRLSPSLLSPSDFLAISIQLHPPSLTLHAAAYAATRPKSRRHDGRHSPPPETRDEEKRRRGEEEKRRRRRD
ncbi:hypothetical protein TEQG_07881 [Trichophyton equinum CBS 127.97]|uniref:Uncharacterized protein n=1 Tax=Trichophyton equinum (strain ATCC MYA-4606 / CBS 127.97) TaxID=559882 RepID=F2Q458_TRIEC|nr:hypothetical protein TEQG_07881 [Trichophyton equinum CBS 127.97]